MGTEIFEGKKTVSYITGKKMSKTKKREKGKRNEGDKQ
jgi:hypothetical protein